MNIVFLALKVIDKYIWSEFGLGSVTQDKIIIFSKAKEFIELK